MCGLVKQTWVTLAGRLSALESIYTFVLPLGRPTSQLWTGSTNSVSLRDLTLHFLLFLSCCAACLPLLAFALGLLSFLVAFSYVVASSCSASAFSISPSWPLTLVSTRHLLLHLHRLLLSHQVLLGDHRHLLLLLHQVLLILRQPHSPYPRVPLHQLCRIFPSLLRMSRHALSSIHLSPLTPRP